RGEASGPRARARGECRSARGLERLRRLRGCSGAFARAARLRPRSGRCTLLGSRCSRLAAGPALAGASVARPAAGSATRGRRARTARRDDRLFGLHAECRRERCRRRRLGAGARASWPGLAAVRPPEAAGVPAHATRPARNDRFLHCEAAPVIEVPERLGWWRERTGGATWLE